MDNQLQSLVILALQVTARSSRRHNLAFLSDENGSLAEAGISAGINQDLLR